MLPALLPSLLSARTFLVVGSRCELYQHAAICLQVNTDQRQLQYYRHLKAFMIARIRRYLLNLQQSAGQLPDHLQKVCLVFLLLKSFAALLANHWSHFASRRRPSAIRPVALPFRTQFAASTWNLLGLGSGCVRLLMHGRPQGQPLKLLCKLP